MSEQPPFPPQDPQQPGWGQQPPQQWGQQQPGWGQQPPPPPGWGQPQYGGSPGPAGYSATDAIGYGWKAFTTHAGALIGAALLALLVPVLIQVIGLAFGGGEVFSFALDGDGFDFDFNASAMLFNIVGSIVSLVMTAGLIRLAFDVIDGHEVSVGNMFSRFDILQVVIAAIVVGVLTSIGLLLCILPGIAVLFFTYLTNYFIVGKGQDAITAIKSSLSLVTNNFGSVLVFALLAFCVMIAGLLACGIGIIVALPVVTVATAYTFRVLQSEPVRPLQ